MQPQQEVRRDPQTVVDKFTTPVDPSLLDQVIEETSRPEARLVESILETELRVSAELEAHRRMIATYKRRVGVRREYICRCGRSDPRWFPCATIVSFARTYQA